MSIDALAEAVTEGDNPSAAEVLDQMRSAAEEAANVLRSIGSPYRLMILCLLVEREKTVTEICDAIGARQSLTSQHLTRLRLDGLVKAERRGHFAYYSLTDTVAKEIVATLYRHYCAKGMLPGKNVSASNAPDT
jgi:ArsR family transcriptional regulator, virulence genes transcriptional regulator